MEILVHLIIEKSIGNLFLMINNKNEMIKNKIRIH